jgi:hypothetical protein
MGSKNASSLAHKPLVKLKYAFPENRISRS